MLVSAIHQHESAICIHMPTPSWNSFPPPTPSYPSRLSHSTGFELPVSFSKLPLAICFTYGNAYVSMPLSQFIPPLLPSLCTQVFSLCLHLHCCPANRFISTIFLDWMYIYICINIQYLFCSFWFTSLYIMGSRFIHLIRTDSNVFLFIAE